MALHGTPSIFTPVSEENTEDDEKASRFCISPDISFHFFTTQVPCELS